jgi:hypothetical protein
MSTPRRIKLNEDIFVIVDDEILVCMGDNHCDWAILVLWDRLAFDTWLELSGNEVIHKFANGFLGEFRTVEGEFLVIDRFLNGEGGPLANFQIEVSSVGTEGFGINGGKADLALVLDR